MASGAKVDLGTMRATDLEKSLKSTIYSKYRKVMDNFILSNLKKESTNFSIPIVQALVEGGSQLEKELLNLYDRKTSIEDTSGISDEIKVLQASVFDGLVVGVNIEKGGETAIYTANMGTIFGLDSESKFSFEKTVDLNRQGIVNAMRIDIEYTSQEGFSFKPVSLNKNTNLKVVNLETGEGRFLLVPYIAIQRAMAFFKDMLDDKRVLEVKQILGDVVKTRYITTREEALVKYCDNEEFARTLKPDYFPLKGFFYAPVLGAPSTTIGKTRIDLISIDDIRSVTKPKVEKARDGLSSLITDSVVQSELVRLSVEDENRYCNLMIRLPHISEYIEDVGSTVPNTVGVMKYLHSLKEGDYMDAVLEIDKETNTIDRSNALLKVLTSFDKVDKDSFSTENVKSLLKDGIYKFTIRKKNCEYSSMIVTNNEDYLKQLYGEDYFGKYESFGTRLYKFENLIKDGKDINYALKYCGLSGEDDIQGKVNEIMSTDLLDKNHHDRLAELFDTSDTSTKKTRRSSSNDSIILARKCFASLTGNGSVDYYRYIDLSKVESIYRLA